MTRCTVIRNPTSRRTLDDVRLRAALDVARDAGWQVDVVSTEREGHATQIARATAAAGVDVVVVHGGDGTINEAVNGIAGTACALGVLPGGTANVFAKELHIKNDPAHAMRAIVHGEPRRIDLGRANGRYFLLMAGVGFDAEAVGRVGPRLKQRLGASAFILAGVASAFRARSVQARVRIDGVERETPLYWMLVGNTRSYGGLSDILYRAVADDGLLDVAMMYRGGPLQLLFAGARMLFKRHDHSPNIDYVTAKSVEIVTPGLPVQIDGEPFGHTPLTIEVVPAALSVMVPHGLRTPLLRDALVRAP